MRLFFLNFKSKYRSDGMIYKSFADTAVEKMSKASSSVCTHSYNIGIDAVGEVDDSFFDVGVIVNMSRVMGQVKFGYKGIYCFL